MAISNYNAPFDPAVRINRTRRFLTLSTPPKSSSDEVTQQQFDALLQWLDPDRDKAGARYEWIRKRLIKIFVCRGSSIAEDLADRTMNRVARKLPEIRGTYQGDPAHYFSGVAVNIFRESLRKEKVPAVGLPDAPAVNEEEERDYACLERCIAKLPAGERDLVLSYYQQEKREKIDLRKKLAERLGVGMNALRIRACRIRAGLQDCMERCRAEEMSKDIGQKSHI
jgi:DNA-directed RNA polymerase specialized sigma24 family protein